MVVDLISAYPTHDITVSHRPGRVNVTRYESSPLCLAALPVNYPSGVRNDRLEHLPGRVEIDAIEADADALHAAQWYRPIEDTPRP